LQLGRFEWSSGLRAIVDGWRGRQRGPGQGACLSLRLCACTIDQIRHFKRVKLTLGILSNYDSDDGFGICFECVCCTMATSSIQGGKTALMWAVINIYGHADCVQLLIDSGAEKEAKSKVQYALNI
jgi:hypothetical protein